MDTSAHPLVISPHPDDAALSIGGLLATRFPTARIWNVFTRSREACGTGEWTTAERRREDEEFADRFGFTSLYSSHSDSNARGVPWENRGVPVADTLIEAVAAELAVLLERTEEVEALLIPAAVGDHPDHRICLAAASLVISETVRTPPPAFLYFEQPYLMLMRAELRGWRREALAEASRLPVRPELREAMLGCYPSQVSEALIAELHRNAPFEWLSPLTAHIRVAIGTERTSHAA